MGICKRYSRNPADASDILSESFLKIFHHIGQYDTAKPFQLWISKIITNTAIDHYRANLKFSMHNDVDEHEDIGDEATVYGKLAYDDLLTLISALSPAYQTVFNLYAIDGYSHNEIADLLGISVNTSKSNLHKARKKLQEMLGEYTREMTNQVIK